MLQDLRGDMVARHQDVGEGLIVPHQHVVAGPQLLDEVGLEQERFHLRPGGDELHRHGFGDHARDAMRMPEAARIARDALLQILRLADIEHVAAFADHAIDAGGVRQRLPGGLTMPAPRWTDDASAGGSSTSISTSPTCSTTSSSKVSSGGSSLVVIRLVGMQVESSVFRQRMAEAAWAVSTRESDAARQTRGRYQGKDASMPMQIEPRSMRILPS